MLARSVSIRPCHPELSRRRAEAEPRCDLSSSHAETTPLVPQGLFIVDLQNPYDPPRFLPHHSAWEVADVQWNPFPSRSEWVASTVRPFLLSESSRAKLNIPINSRIRKRSFTTWGSRHPSLVRVSPFRQVGPIFPPHSDPPFRNSIPD